MTSRALRALLGAALVAGLVAGCSSDDEPVVVGTPAAAEPTEPAYDPSLEPAAAVLAIVPGDAEVLEVTDFDQIRLQLGFGDMTSDSDLADRRRFWRRAERTAPLLSPGLLRDPRARYEKRFGFSQDDVEWEAHFDGPSGEGYVVKFHDELPMRGVARAAATSTGPLAGATVVTAAHVAALGATREPTESWAAEPELVELVGQVAGATYVTRTCLEPDQVFGAGVGDLAPVPAADLGALDPLGPFSVTFGGSLVTVRLGSMRDDVFDRARLAGILPATDPDFGLGYADPVADPQSGRIGYTLGDGPVAARLAREQLLPFAVCGA